MGRTLWRYGKMKSAINCPYYFWSAGLSNDVCDLIIKEGLKLSAEEATLDQARTKDNKLRKGLISFFPENTWIEKLVIDYVGAANKEANWNYVVTGKELLQFANYRTEAFYDWHRDCNINSDLYRKLSVTIQLSDPEEYEGGELQFKNYWGTSQLLVSEDMMKKGTVIVFPSSVLHRVTPIIKGTRYSLVQWYNGPDFT